MPETVSLRYGEAVNAALRRALQTWPEVLLYGEDVARPGGVFGVTRRLRRDFGDRVFDTPISESAIIGSAVGAAMLGRRPIVEIMWIDFTLVGIDQLINQAANVRYVSRGEVCAPLTIRTQQGATPGSCAQHSQSLEALFTHVPGLRVALPSTPQDAYDVLLSAIASNDPTLVIEARGLYNGDRDDVFVGGEIAPVGGSRHRRHGSDLTVVTWGAISRTVEQAAASLATDGIDIDVIETVWLNPFDTDAVLDSVGRTGRLLVVHEANTTGGFGAEVLARLAESGIALRTPPRRIGLSDIRVPAAPHLSAAVLPTSERILAAARDLLAAPPTPASSSCHVQMGASQ
jgi:pyruvate/2-oxoglutarate/acetoin dehydrogenase E1 component